MGRAPCCEKQGLKKGPWTPEEDEILVDYIKKNGHGSWRSLPKLAGLLRCGKSCRLRWTNYLRPDIKRGPFTPEEEKTIIQLHAIVGNRWSTIATQLPGRTDNEIKNFWNTHLKKRLVRMGLDPAVHTSGLIAASSPASLATRHMAQWESARLEAEARMSRESLLIISQSDHPLSNPGKSETDHFLRIWNSDVGESFRRLRNRDLTTTTCCNSPISPASSSTAMAAAAAAAATASTITSDRCGSDDIGTGVLVKSDPSSSSDEMEEDDDSQDTSLNLLLDFPADEMGFLQGGQIGNFSIFPCD